MNNVIDFSNKKKQLTDKAREIAVLLIKHEYRRTKEYYPNASGRLLVHLTASLIIALAAEEAPVEQFDYLKMYPEHKEFFKNHPRLMYDRLIATGGRMKSMVDLATPAPKEE